MDDTQDLPVGFKRQVVANTSVVTTLPALPNQGCIDCFGRSFERLCMGYSCMVSKRIMIQDSPEAIAQYQARIVALKLTS